MSKEIKAVPAEDTCLKFIFYKMTMEASVAGLLDADTREVVIPSQVLHDGDVYDVTMIGWFAFEYYKNLTSIAIPNSVGLIGEYAFLGCESLTSIVVDKDNKVYDSRNNCNAIIETASNTLIVGCQNTVIPESVTTIGLDAFYRCTNLTSIEIPNSVIKIGEWAFEDCESLKTAKVPEALKGEIVESAFPETCEIEFY